MSNIPTSGNIPNPLQNPQLLNEIQTEVSNEAAPLLQFLTTHAIKIMLILGLFVVAVAGFGVYNWQQSSAFEKAQSELNVINQSKQGAERITALESFLASAPASLHSAIVLSIAETSMLAENYAKAAEAYGKLAQLHVDSATAILGALNQGQALILAGQGKEAVTVLESLATKVSTDQSTIVQQALAEAALLSGDTAKAKAAFEAIANATLGTESEFYRYRARTAGAPSEEKK